MSTSKSQNIANFSLCNVAFSVLVEDDRLKAYLTSNGLPFANQPVRADYLLDELKRVLHPPFIDESCITDYVNLLNNGSSPKARRIAKGIAPIVGQHARVVPLVRILVDPNDSYPELTKNKFFENVSVGSPVARYYPPTEGLPGMSVVGET